MPTVQVPNFSWSALYYPQLLEALLVFKRDNVPEHTDESATDPLNQLLRAFACIGHLNNTLLDQVANESTLPTAHLVETVRNMLRLIDYELASAIPAQTDIIGELSQVLGTSIVVVPSLAQVATQGDAVTVSRVYESDDASLVQRTDQLLACYGVEDGIYTNYTTVANTVGTTFSPWSTPVGGTDTREGDSLLFCHGEVMPDTVEFTISTGSTGIIGVWEYFDGLYQKAVPDTITDLGTAIRVNLTTYLGTASRAGTPIRITYNVTGAYEDVYSTFSGGINVATSERLFGQTTPSLLQTDYSVGSPWERFENLEDETNGLNEEGAVTFDLPQTLTRNWSLGTFNGIQGYWMRYRIITLDPNVALVSPIISLITIDTGRQYVKFSVTQGQTQDDIPLGSSDGTANQSFEGSQDHYLHSTATVFVDEIEWLEVDNFLGSRGTDRHFIVQRTANDRPVFRFGDGIAGAIPPIGANNIRASYRYGADENGNVGAETISVDRAGLTYINKLWNPRPAVGWRAAEGSTEESLELAKIAGPASLRVREVALGPDDIEILALRAPYIDPNVIAISRAVAIEEGFGPKTIMLVVVPSGGNIATTEQLTAISYFFNGDRFSAPVRRKRVIANQEVAAVNYLPRTIDITMEMRTRGNTTEAEVLALFQRLLQPEAVKEEDGVTFEWDFGGRVPTSRLVHEVFSLDKFISDVDITVPAEDVQLLPTELPVFGTLTITIIRE